MIPSHNYHFSDPLWDGEGCSIGNTCCSNTDQPWFYHKLSKNTQDDIEVRICRDEKFYHDGILVDILELYSNNVNLQYSAVVHM